MTRGVALLAFLLIGAAHAETQWLPPEEIGKAAPAQSDPRPQPKPVAAYGDDHSDCREWTDGCVVCKRQEAGDPACSTPGVACLPAEPACVSNVSDRPTDVSGRSNR